MRSILGLGRKTEPASTRDVVKRKFECFMRILSENHLALRVISELQEKATGDYLFEQGYLRLNVDTLSASVRTMIQRLGELSETRYPELTDIHRRLDQQVQGELAQRKKIPADDLTIPLAEICAERTESVGGKNAHLGEMRNRIGLPVPDGFAISACAYQRFVGDTPLAGQIDEYLTGLDINDLAATAEISNEIRRLIGEQPLPEGLEREVAESCETLQRRAGCVSLAVRSSAVGEGTESSFAGQYATVLNVPCSRVLNTYREIVASKFAPRALFYFINRGFRQEEVAMSVCCMAMVPSKASGVLCTVDPIDPDSGNLIISSRWGLGRGTAEGSLPTDFFRVAKADKRILESKVIPQESMLTMPVGEEGVRVAPVPAAFREEPSLAPAQIAALVDYALRLEQHYGAPQDVEWVVDQEGQIVLMQTRTLALTRDQEDLAARPPLPGYRLLLERGERAAAGVGHGRVFPVERDEDLGRFPNGAVLVARRTSPKFVAVMNKARAIVTDEGRAAGHMATLAREFRVPAIVNAGNATQVLAAGSEVTVDATHQRVYEGRVEPLLRRPRARPGIFRETPAFAILQKVLPAIVPLALIDPDDASFRPDACRSFHDLTRFCHQTAMQEMYRLAEEAARHMDQACRVKAGGIPLEVYVLDLGGGIEAEPTARTIDPEALTSLPMRAFWTGLTSIAWAKPRPTPGGFLSVVAHTVADPELQQRLEEKSLAILSREYMNFSLRLGYHISTVEGLCTAAVEDSYLRFYFHGGAASAERRLRRARLVEKIVEQNGFLVQRQGETVEAILTHCDRGMLEEKAEMLGRLTVYTKQLDMAMFNDSIVEVFAEEFLKGQYARPA